jgi:hypothetical protein
MQRPYFFLQDFFSPVDSCHGMTLHFIMIYTRDTPWRVPTSEIKEGSILLAPDNRLYLAYFPLMVLYPSGIREQGNLLFYVPYYLQVPIPL